VGADGENPASSPTDPRAGARDAVAAWLARVNEQKDPAIVLDPGAARDARRLTELLGDDHDDLHSRLFLGWLHFYRSQVLPQDQATAEVDAAVTMLTPCFMSDMELEHLPPPFLPILAEQGAPTVTLLTLGLSTADLSLVSTLVEMWRRILAATPPDHPARAERLSGLGAALQERFSRTGVRADLDEMISVTREGLAGLPDSDPARSALLSNLNGALQDRFRRAGAPADLDEAIEVGRQTLTSTPDDRLDWGALLSNLGAALRMRFARTGREEDLDEAIRVGQEAVTSTPADHPDRGVRLANLEIALRLRIERTGRPADLAELIQVAQAKEAAEQAGQPAARAQPSAEHPASGTSAQSIAAKIASEILGVPEPGPGSDPSGDCEASGQPGTAQPHPETFGELIQQGRLDEARALLTASLDEFRDPSDIGKQGQVLLLLARLEHRLRHHGAAIGLGRRAIRASYSAGERLEAAAAHAFMANFLASGSAQESAEAPVHILAAAVIRVRESQELLTSEPPLVVHALVRLTFCLARHPHLVPESFAELQRRLRETTGVDIGELLAGLRRIAVLPDNPPYGIRYHWEPGAQAPGDSVTDALCWANRRPPPHEITDVDGHPGNWQPIIDAVAAAVGNEAGRGQMSEVLDDYRGSGWGALADALDSLMADPGGFILPPSLPDAERLIIQRTLAQLR
jgi:tetratricopeptide (TPR) repeat protein